MIMNAWGGTGSHRRGEDDIMVERVSRKDIEFRAITDIVD